MAAPPSNAVPTISPAEMQILVSRAGLVLNPGQVADLVLAWRQMAGLIASIPQERKLVDDLAYSFRLPSPAAAPQAKQVRAPAKPKPPAKRTVSRAAKAKRAVGKAKPKRAAPKAKAPRTAKPKARHRATRRQ